jgi:hypothetical protein
MSLWAKEGAGTHGKWVLQVHDSNAFSDKGYALQLQADKTVAILGDASVIAATSTTAGSGWFNMCGAYDGSSAWKVFLNGAGKGTATSSFTPASTPDRYTIGCRRIWIGFADIFLNGFDGQLAEGGIWDVVLTDDECKALGKGAAPPLVRPGSLKHYWRMIGEAFPENDMYGRIQIPVISLTPGHGASHPPVFHPAWQSC